MKEAFEDRITRKIKEVMVQYEPEYTPQAWKDFRKHKRRREFWLTRFFLKYRYWFTGIIITCILIVIFRGLSPIFPEKEVTAVSQDSEPVIYPGKERMKEVPVPERPVILSQNSQADTTAVENIISYNYLPVPRNDSLSANHNNKIQIENEIPGIPDTVEMIPAGSGLLDEVRLSPRLDNSQLKKIELKPVKVPDLTSDISDRTRKTKLQLPEFSALTTQDNNYRKFTGPNKFVLFYTTEFHQSTSIKTIGASHGLGFIIEGPIRSFISISAGVSFQSLNFNKTFISGHFPDYLPPLYIPYVEKVIVRSGSYKYLELPVSVNLRFLKSARSQVWIGTGISSLAFMKQTYTYEITIKDDIYKVDISANAWENVHPLGSLNFNLVYRFKITGRLFLNSSLQYKLHLVPLGYNSMKLNRLNLQIGMGYRFGRYD